MIHVYYLIFLIFVYVCKYKGSSLKTYLYSLYGSVVTKQLERKQN